MSEAAGAPAGPVATPTVRELGLTFSTLAFESFGGGLAAWVQRVVVEEKRWLDEDEYLSASTICGILPGANQVNMAVFVGTRFPRDRGGDRRGFGVARGGRRSSRSSPARSTCASATCRWSGTRFPA